MVKCCYFLNWYRFYIVSSGFDIFDTIGVISIHGVLIRGITPYCLIHIGVLTSDVNRTAVARMPWPGGRAHNIMT